MLRSGTVVDRRAGPNGAEVRVAYPDRGVTSDWLPVGQSLAGGAMSHSCPRINTNVIVGHLPTGIEQGVVLCSTPTGNGGALIPSHLDETVTVFEDGAAIGYNPQSGVLNVVGINQITIGAGGTVSVYSGGNLLLQISGDLDASVAGNLNATVAGTATVTAPTVNVNASSAIMLNSPKVTCTGTFYCDQFKPNQASAPTATPHMTNQDGSGGGT